MKPQVDHDHAHLTSTLPEHVPERTFFLGEIWWADRFALGDRRPHPPGKSHLSALVTRRESRPGMEIAIAPPSNRAPEEIRSLCFRAEAPPKELNSETLFLLPYRRHVARQDLGAHLATLTGRDKQELQRLLERMRRSAAPADDK